MMAGQLGALRKRQAATLACPLTSGTAMIGGCASVMSRGQQTPRRWEDLVADYLREGEIGGSITPYDLASR